VDHDIEIRPAHQARDVATGEQHRTDVGDDRHQVDLGQHLGRLGLQPFLPRPQYVAGCGTRQFDGGHARRLRTRCR
jgi:hypothetical protein